MQIPTDYSEPPQEYRPKLRSKNPFEKPDKAVLSDLKRCKQRRKAERKRLRKDGHTER